MNRPHEDKIARTYRQGKADGLDKGRRAMKKELFTGEHLVKLLRELPRPTVYKAIRETHEHIESIIEEYNPNAD